MSLQLSAVEKGSGPVLAILHGLYGSGRNWSTIATRLAASHRVITLDLRNHGASPWAPRMDYRALAADVIETLYALGHRHFALLGHSMGGKAAMTLALSHPAAVERLVVVDIAPVSYPSAQLGYAEAMRALDLAEISRRSQADVLLSDAVPDAAERAFLLQNLVFDDGKARWRVNLTVIEHEMATLAGFPDVPNGATYEGPSIFIAGERSDYLRTRHMPAILRLFPAAQFATIAGAGHWVHAEQPRALLDLVEAFLLGTARERARPAR